MQKKKLISWKPGVAAIVAMGMLSISVLESNAAFEPGYYNIKENGGTFNGRKYVLEDGTKITDSFFCDGKYTYFLQADGTPMKNRLTYHPDGKQIIYFDSNGRECFDTFTNVKKSIEGKDVDDLCYFGTTGNLYQNVITYNREGTAIYYANKCGVMERNGVFQLETDAKNYKELANGCHYGYADKNGKVLAFFKTYEEALAYKPDKVPEKTEKYPVLKDENGNVYDLGGMEIIIRDWWSPQEASEPSNEYEEARQEYVEWAQETYNFTIKQVAISDWGSAPTDFIDYVSTGGDDINYIFTLRNDNTTSTAMKYGFMFDLNKLDCLDFIESKFQRNLLHEQYSVKGKTYAMDTGYPEPRAGIYFNKQVLQDAGIDLESIYDMQANGTWTWDAWTKMMEKVQRDIDNDGDIDVYGFDSNYGISVMAAVYSNDTDLVGMKNGKYTYEFENPKTVAALEWIQEAFDDYSIKRPEYASWDYYKEAFGNGECAFLVDEMYCSGPNGYLEMEMKDELGFVMFPKGPEASDYVNKWEGNPKVIPGCYTEERAWKIAFAYDVYTEDIPGYEDYDISDIYNDFKGYILDERAKTETIPMMAKKGMISYDYMIPNLDLGEYFLWNFGNRSNVNVSGLLKHYRNYYTEAINNANE